MNAVRCESCGAPRAHVRCAYCGTEYHWAPVNEGWADDLDTMAAWQGDVISYVGGYQMYEMPRSRRMPPGTRYFR